MTTFKDLLSDEIDGNPAADLARQFGVSEAQAQAVLDALSPALAAGLAAKAGDGTALAGLEAGLGGGARGIASLGTADALGEVFGGKRKMTGATTRAAKAAGVPAPLVQQMLPSIASMVVASVMRSLKRQGIKFIMDRIGQALGTGGVGRSRSAEGMLGDLIGNVLGGAVGGKGKSAEAATQSAARKTATRKKAPARTAAKKPVRRSGR
jgi:hypothetical protein